MPMPRPATLTSYVLYTLYALYAVAGAIAQKQGTTLPFRIGEVGEFALFATATVCFVAGIIQSDQTHEKLGFWATLDAHGERYAMLVFYVFVCIVIVQEVLRRFVLNYSSAWAQETAQYAFIYLGYVGAAYAVKERAHIRFDVMINRVSPRVQGYLYIFAELCTFLFACIAVYWSMHTIRQLLQFEGTTPVLRINKAWFEAAVPIGFALVAWRCIQSILRDARDIRAGRPVYAGKAMFDA
jgi:C4-dicarboxylate transporter, DctQ subunit